MHTQNCLHHLSTFIDSSTKLPSPKLGHGFFLFWRQWGEHRLQTARELHISVLVTVRHKYTYTFITSPMFWQKTLPKHISPKYSRFSIHVFCEIIKINVSTSQEEFILGLGFIFVWFWWVLVVFLCLFFFWIMTIGHHHVAYKYYLLGSSLQVKNVLKF